jgi:hypothetical protein
MNENDFDFYLNASRDYLLYRGLVDETDNLPPGIHASIWRYEPTHPCELEPEPDPAQELELESDRSDEMEL